MTRAVFFHSVLGVAASVAVAPLLDLLPKGHWICRASGIIMNPEDYATFHVPPLTEVDKQALRDAMGFRTAAWKLERVRSGPGAGLLLVRPNTEPFA